MSILLERVEGLEAEDREDREAYEQEVAQATVQAADAGEAAPIVEPWP